MSLGMASLEEIRDAVLRFRQSGKWVIGYSDYYTQASYYMSTTAEKVYLNPEGGVEWVGLASGVLFYKGLLDKMDLQPEVIRHGEFKAAVEPFITDRMSPANRLQMERLLGSIWGHVVQNVASARGIDSTDLQRYASELTLADGGCCASGRERTTSRGTYLSRSTSISLRSLSRSFLRII